MASREAKPPRMVWKITRMHASLIHGMHSENGRDFGVQLNVTLDADPDRTVLARLTPDQADALAQQLQEFAAEARRQTELAGHWSTPRQEK